MQKSHLRLSCPHCGSFARIRKSEGLTPIYREALLECANVDCNWRGRMEMTMTHTYTPSDRPRDGVDLPLSPRQRAKLDELSDAR